MENNLWDFEKFHPEKNADQNLPGVIIESQQNIFNDRNIFEGLVILVRQQAMISKDTADYGLVEPQIKESVIIRLKIHAPKLKEYTANFIFAKHSIVKAYPCYVRYALIDQEYEKCNSAQELMERLKIYFQHENTIQFLSSLYDQSKMISNFR
jgi:hypothetical protein